MPLVSLRGCKLLDFWCFFLGFLEKRQYFKSSRSRLELHAKKYKKIYRNINSTLVYGVFYRSNNPEACRDWPLLIHGGCNDKKFVAFF